MSNFEIGNEAVELIKRYEGLRLKAYKDSEGNWTIGWGHTSDQNLEVREGLEITHEQAEEILRIDIDEAAAAVDRLVRVPLARHQRDALVSFVFNIGEGQFKRSTLLRKLNAADYDAVPAQIKRWVYGKHPITHQKVVLPGLERRRAAEAALWSNKAS